VFENPPAEEVLGEKDLSTLLAAERPVVSRKDKVPLHVVRMEVAVVLFQVFRRRFPVYEDVLDGRVGAGANFASESRFRAVAALEVVPERLEARLDGRPGRRDGLVAERTNGGPAGL
jgi:hypothetical protein